MKYTVKQMIDITACLCTLLVLIIALPNCIYTVHEQEQAVIIRFGVPVSTNGSGLHLKLPFIEQVKKVSMVSKGFTMGYRESANQFHTTVELESFMITRDLNFVNVDFFVEYRVSVPSVYLFASSEPEEILRNLVQAEVRAVVCEYNVDEVLTTAKAEIQTKIRDRVISDLEEIDIGITLISINMQDSDPPTQEVITAFKNVENAKQQKDTAINQAQKEYNEAIPAARANADAIVQEAVGYRQSRINEAVGQVARFDEMFNEYIKNKEITRTRLYLEAMEEILPHIKLVVGTGENLLPFLDLTTHETPHDTLPAASYLE
ncbi:MAG: FtsH protease activity modulator HflK [Defluviitaleaceae bacterium]|nr:FtsH protease activity modulator HflK [Defluviitaleaceae bacterium]